MGQAVCWVVEIQWETDPVPALTKLRRRDF